MSPRRTRWLLTVPSPRVGVVLQVVVISEVVVDLRRPGGHRPLSVVERAERADRFLDWFEDPVWRQDRIVAINLHMITAFLDRYVKDDASRAAYLDGLTRESTGGEWPASAALPYDAYSPGANGITIWKGFQRGHAEGLELLHATPR